MRDGHKLAPRRAQLGRWGYGRQTPLRRAVNGKEHLGSSPSVMPYAAHCLKCPLFLELGALI